MMSHVGLVDRRLSCDEKSINNYDAHSIFECRTSTGNNLNRRSLQYKGGDCKCGKYITVYLGITSANENQNTWRRNLYLGNYTRKNVEKVEKLFRPVFNAMKLWKTFMIV